MSTLGWQEQHRVTENREERTIKGHRVHHAKIGCLELSSSGTMKTSSWPVPSLPYHGKTYRDPSYSRSFLFSGPSNTKTGCHFPHSHGGLSRDPHPPSISPGSNMPLTIPASLANSSVNRRCSREEQKPLPYLRDGVQLLFASQAISPTAGCGSYL